MVGLVLTGFNGYMISELCFFFWKDTITRVLESACLFEHAAFEGNWRH